MAVKEDAAAGAGGEALKEDLERLRADVAALGATLKGMAGESGQAAYTRAREAAGHARDTAEESIAVVGREIGERPLVSVLIAFLIGLLLGKLLSR